MYYDESLKLFYTFGEDGLLRVFTTDKEKVNLEIHEKFIEKGNMESLKNPDFTEE